jgi:AmiR/NasT family two-component response regulator
VTSLRAVPDLRVLLGEISSEWEQTIQRLAAADQGLKIVGQVNDPLRLLLEAKTLRADVVVVSQLPDGSEPGICSHLVLELPNVIVVLVPASPGNHGLIRMVLFRELLPASDVALYSAIRGGVALT